MPKYFNKGRNQNRRTDRFIEDATRDEDRNYYGKITRNYEKAPIYRV
jgi:hypothetical protein